MDKFKYNGKVISATPAKMLLYVSNGKANANGLVLVKHVLTGDIGYYQIHQFNKLFEKLPN